jgi:tetratricopeptide (TPR) repeat protein
MSVRKLLMFLVISLGVIAGSYKVIQKNTSAVPIDPSLAVDSILPSYGMKTTPELIDFWHSRIQQNSNSYIDVTFLGEAYLRRGRETGDVSAYQTAEAAFRKALAINPKYELTLSDLSATLYVMHDFQRSLDLANQVYESDPKALQVLANIGDAQMELGHYAEAETAFQELFKLSPTPPVLARLSRLSWIHGKPAEAIQQMKKAADDAIQIGISGEEVAWYQFQLGDLYFKTGQYDFAAQRDQNALDLFNNYYLALQGLAKARAAQGKSSQALDLLNKTVAIIPQPEYLALLGDLYTLSGQPELAQRQYDTVEFIGKLDAINQVIYNRQVVLYDANHDLNLPGGLILAQKEIAVRKDVYGYDALAWALYKNGKLEEANQAAQQALRLGTPEALFYYHAGMIAAARGQSQAAQKLLSQALQLNASFDPLQAQQARKTLARLTSNELPAIR